MRSVLRHASSYGIPLVYIDWFTVMLLIKAHAVLQGWETGGGAAACR
jgi:hypothetical protein